MPAPEPFTYPSVQPVPTVGTAMIIPGSIPQDAWQAVTRRLGDAEASLVARRAPQVPERGWIFDVRRKPR